MAPVDRGTPRLLTSLLLLSLLLAHVSLAAPGDGARDRLERELATFRADQISAAELERRLGVLREDLWPALREVLPSRAAAGRVRGVLLRMLPRLDRQRGQALLLELAGEGRLGLSALEALGEVGNADAIAPLFPLLDDEGVQRRERARVALREIARRHEATEVLSASLRARVERAGREPPAPGGPAALALLVELNGYETCELLVECLRGQPLRVAALNALVRLPPPDLEVRAQRGWRDLVGALEQLLSASEELSSLQQRQVLAAFASFGTHGQLPFLIAYGEGELDPPCHSAWVHALERITGYEHASLERWRAYWRKVEPIWERYEDLLAAVRGGTEADALAALDQVALIRSAQSMEAIASRLEDSLSEALLLRVVDALVQLAMPDVLERLDQVRRNPGATEKVLQQVAWAEGFFQDRDEEGGDAVGRRRKPGRKRKGTLVLGGSLGADDPSSLPWRMETSRPRESAPAPTPPPAEGWLRRPQGREWFLVLVGAALLGLVALALVPTRQGRQRGVLQRPEELEDTRQGRLQRYLQQKIVEGSSQVSLQGEEDDEVLLAGFEAGLSLLRGDGLSLDDDDKIEPRTLDQIRAAKANEGLYEGDAPTAPLTIPSDPRVDLSALISEPEDAPLALEDDLGALPPEADAFQVEQWRRMLARLRRLGPSVSWVGARLASHPDRFQTVFDTNDWVPFTTAVEELEVLEPVVDEIRVQLRPLILREALSEDAAALLDLVPSQPSPAAQPVAPMNSRRWEKLRRSLQSLGGSLEEVWVELEGDDAPRCLFRGGSLAALEAQLSALRGRLARVRIRIQGCPTELVLFDSQEDSHSAQAAPQTSAPWLSGLAPGVDQWSQLLASIRSLRRTVRRLELLSTLARGSRQVIYSIEDPDADFESALAGLDNARPIVEEVRLFLLGQEQELVLFRREEDEAVALLPGGAAGPEPEEADEWASALASLAQLQPVLREVWVTAGGGSAEPWLTTKGFAATLSALRSRPVSRLAVELAGASQAVVLYEPEGTSSGEGPVQSEAASWEDLPATLEDLEPVLEALVLHHSDGTRRELRGQLGATGLWEQARAARARGLERVEAELLGLGSRLLYRAPTHEQLSLRQLRAAMIRAQPPLVAELHLPPGQQVPLPPDPASAVAALEDLFPVLASVRDASGALVFEQAATERHLLEPPAEEAFPALPGQATIDLSGDPDFARLSTALSNVISTAEAVIATLAEGDEHRLSPGTAESVLAQRWEEVRAVAVVLPGLETPLVLLQRAAPSRDDRRWREVSKALERLGSQVKSLLVELREGEPARWHSEGGYAYERFLKGLQAHRANVKRVLVRLRGSPHDLVLFSLEESPSGALKRRDAGHATSAVWDPMREAISHMEPLIEAVEARLSNQAEVYQPIYLDGGDLEAALSRLDGMRQRLESIRVRFQPICLFQRYRPSDSVLLEPPR